MSRLVGSMVLVGLAVVALAACGGEAEEARFPPGFLWGASVAGFQVDMGCPTIPEEECTDTRSDWYAWVTTPELIAAPGTHLSGDPVTAGPGHWELYEEDFDRVAGELGLGGFRMSLEWSRIFPESTIGIDDPEELAALADAANLAHYRAMLTALRERGVEPLVTLHHYTLPIWLHDAVGCHADLAGCAPRGWLDRAVIVHEIAKYAAFVTGALGDLVDRWATENEPFAVVLAGYLQPGPDRTNPPGVSFAFDEAKQVAAAMIEGHAAMYDAVKLADTGDADGDGVPSEVGLVFAVTPTRPVDPGEPLDVAAAANVGYLYNWAFLDAVVLGLLDEELDGEQVPRDDLQGRLDYLGVNYYAVTWVEGIDGPALADLSPLSTFNPFTLEIDLDAPDGLHEALMLLTDRYPGVPLYVTENGTHDTADGDAQRRYLAEHLRHLSRAWRDGADVRGYFYWSLIDNYEWNHGMALRFGLYAVDPNDPAKERVARPAVADYARIIAENRVPADLLP